MKTCWKCKTEKTEVEFYKNKRQSDGRDTCCKECRITVSRQYGRTVSGKRKNYQKNAKRRGYEWSLSDEQFESLVNSACHYCGTSEGLNGVDRTDNDKGYTPSNAVACCTKCNTAKNTMTSAQYAEFISRVHGHMTRGER